MARVSRTLAFVSLMVSVVLPFEVAHAQAPDTKADQTKKKRSSPANKAGEAAAADAAGETKKTADPAAVQKSLDSAQKALDAGKAEVAVNQINSLIGLGGLESRSMARALALRGQAYRRQSKPAQAISDLQSAIWLKGGLNETERATAIQARAEAYREAGLGEPPGITAVKSGAPPTNQNSPNATNLSTAAVIPKTEAAPAAPAASGGFFSNLFGGNTQKPATVEPSPAKAPADPAVSSWSTQGAAPSTAKATAATSAPSKSLPPATAARAAAVAATPATPKVPETAATGGFKIQLAAMRTREEAQALVDRVKKENASLLGKRTHHIDETKFGNMGVFYRPRFDAFASANEAKSACASLRGKGVDCLASE